MVDSLSLVEDKTSLDCQAVVEGKGAKDAKVPVVELVEVHLIEFGQVTQLSFQLIDNS